MTDRNEVANHEKLIDAAEAIAEYHGSLWPGELSESEITYFRALARTALAVFEKELGGATVTPSDDEREALAFTLFLIESGQDEDWLRGVWANHPAEHPVKVGYYRQADAILAAGFRRTEVPEPSAPRGRSRGRHTDEQMLYMICLALEEGLEGVANIDLPDLIVKMISEHWGTVDADTSSEEAEAALAQLEPYIPDHMRTPETQGEPSDAWLNNLSYAATALEASADNGDRYCARLIREHLSALRAANEVR